ncbi:MAG: hypothetical protein IPH18_18145 [Chitinophagaceae bacterium]|nr:hypothetical protein [Chitinophagaceae bacterium]
MLGDDHYILFLDDGKRNLQEVFPGFNIQDAWSIKLTRDAEMNLEDEFIGDIAEKIEKQLERREGGHATRLLFDQRMPESVRDFVQKYFDLRTEELVPGGRYHNLKDLGGLPNPVKKENSADQLAGGHTSGFNNHLSIFQSISKGKIVATCLIIPIIIFSGSSMKQLLILMSVKYILPCTGLLQIRIL